MTERRTLQHPDPRPALWIGLALLAGLSLLFQFVDWDKQIAGAFYAWPGGAWPGQRWAWSHALWAYGEWPAYATGVLGCLAFLGSYRINALRRWRGPGLFLGLLLLLGPGLLVNVLGKDLSGRPRPSEVLDFGGMWAFARPWHLGTPGRGHAFPGGHASMGFYWVSLYFLARKRLTRALGLIAGLSLGAAMSVARMAQGGHFLSDNLISGALVFTLAAALAPLIDWQPPVDFWRQRKVVLPLLVAALGCLIIGHMVYEERDFLWARPGALTQTLPTQRLQEWAPGPGPLKLALQLELQRGDLQVQFSAPEDGQRLPLQLSEAFSGLGLPGAKDGLKAGALENGDRFSSDADTLGVKLEQELRGAWFWVSARYELRLPETRAVDARLKTARGVLTIGHLPDGRQVLINGDLRALDLPLGFKPFGEHAWLRDGAQPQIALDLSAPTLHFEP